MKPVVVVWHCPRCRGALDGGPVLFWCSCCRRSVYAADAEPAVRAEAGEAA